MDQNQMVFYKRLFIKFLLIVGQLAEYIFHSLVFTEMGQTSCGALVYASIVCQLEILMKIQ